MPRPRPVRRRVANVSLESPSVMDPTGKCCSRLWRGRPRRAPPPPPAPLGPFPGRQAPRSPPAPPPPQESQLGRKVGPATVELDAARLVAGRGAARRRDDVAIGEREAIIARRRSRLAGEPVAMQRLVQPITARVSREHAPGAVRSVRRRCEPDDEQPRIRIAEARDRRPPVLPVAKLPFLVSGDAAAIGPQPRAARATDDGVVDGGEGSEQSETSRSEFPP